MRFKGIFAMNEANGYAQTNKSDSACYTAAGDTMQQNSRGGTEMLVIHCTTSKSVVNFPNIGYTTPNRINKSRPEGVTSTRRALTRDTKGTRAMATPYSTTPHFNDQLDYILKTARFICADLNRLVYWDPSRLTAFADQVQHVQSDYAQGVDTDALFMLDTAEEAVRRECIRRDQLCDPNYLPKQSGVVYLLSTSIGFYKIGCSSRPENRLLNFGLTLPFEIELVCAVRSVDMYGLERKLHAKFKDELVKGEWYTLNTRQVRFMERFARLVR